MKMLSLPEKDEMVIKALEDMKAGKRVDISIASYDVYGLCIGDFMNFGYSKKNHSRDGLSWTWMGPGAVYIDGKLIKPNEQTEEIEIDWN